jgi:glycerophosphoryl diester phosphodiesterase
MFARIPRPTIFAHRGASDHAPENTLPAFELALQQGADAIELDVKLCADSEVVVLHDQTVDRTTDGTGDIRQLSLAEIKKLDAGSHFDIAFQGETIPTLAEVFEAVGRRTYINIELTNYASLLDSLPEQVARLVKQNSVQDRVLFSSFNPIALIKAHRHLPVVPIGLLAQPGKSGALARSWLGRLIGYYALHPEHSDVTRGLVESCHRWSKRVHVYTVNEEEEMRRLFGLHVDGIFTDDPVLARRILAAPREADLA